MTAKQDNLIYRIMDFPRAVEIFKKKELYFAHPSSWEDPHETRFRHSENRFLFASCWCQSAISDAMWRIYSQNRLGIRISVEKTSLEKAVKDWLRARSKGVKSREDRYRWRGREVTYCTQKEISQKIKTIKTDLESEPRKTGKEFISRAADALYLKREAFSHEDEWRALVFCPGINTETKSIHIPVEPHSLIRNILIDPRAPAELVDAFKHYFNDVLNFKKTVTQSTLYKMPSPIEVDEEIL